MAAAPRVAGDHFALITELAATYPGDPGIAISLMLNLTTLSPGEVLYLPAGNIHAYIDGTGVELMAASDNVLRGGLTPKHIDVPELLRVLDFRPTPVPYLAPLSPAPGVEDFRPAVPDFRLLHITEPYAFDPGAEAVVLCTSGSWRVASATGETRLERGQACFVSADERELAFNGHGEIFVASSNGVLA